MLFKCIINILIQMIKLILKVGIVLMQIKPKL